jgi:hypothetical protein
VWFLCVHLSSKSRVLRLCKLCGQVAVKSELNEKVSIWVVGCSLFLSFVSGYMVSSNLCHLSAPWTPLFLLPQKHQPPRIRSLSPVSWSRANPKPKRTFYAAQHLNQPTNKTRGVSHYGLAIYMKKFY